jgi:hypothetical protein
LKELLPLASPVDRIVLGRKYGFNDWLTPAFVAVCARAEPLSLEEAKRMDGEDVARIYQAREQARGSSTAVATEVAQAAVTSVFGNSEEATVITSSDANDTAHCTSSTMKDLNVRPENSYAEEVFSESLATDLPADDAKVDDSLMEALTTWSRICFKLDDSSFDTSPNGHYNQHGQAQHYLQYKANCESLLTYVGSPHLQAISLRRLLSIMLQSDLHSKRPALYAQLWKDLRNRLDKTSGDKDEDCTAAGLGTADFDCMLNDQCLELAKNECALPGLYGDLFYYKNRSAQLVARLISGGLLNNITLRACIPHLIPLPAHLDTNHLENVCTLIKNFGKTLDREGSRDVIDDIFGQLRRHALKWKHQRAHKQIIVSSRQV